MKQQLASYKVPREVVFLDELPRNATGKVLKRELRSRLSCRLVEEHVERRLPA